MKITKKKIAYFAGILFLLNIFAWQEVFYLSSGAEGLKVYFLDVGQGDAIFIETPQSHQILVDGGPDSTVIEKLREIMPPLDKTIDLVILTHPEKDHMQGLIEVLQRYEVDYILWTGILRQTAEYKKWIEALSEEQRQGAKLIKAVSSKTIIASKAKIDILYPDEDLSGKELENSNDSSVVFNLDFGENNFLFTGDITSKTEEFLLNNENSLKSDVLKVPHHGSKYSTSDYFLASINPQLGVISAGKKNPYGHPTPEVLQRLEKFGIKALRTDRDGDVEIISDGNNIFIRK